MKYSLDIHDVELTKDGVKNFFYPINQDQFSHFETTFYETVYPHARFEPGGDKINELFCLVLPFFYREALHIFRIHRLIKESSALGYEIHLPEDHKQFHTIKRLQKPPLPSYLHSWNFGPDRAKFYTAPFLVLLNTNQINDRFTLESINWFTRPKCGSIHDIPLIHQHARLHPQSVRYLLIGNYFEQDVRQYMDSPNLYHEFEPVINAVLHSLHTLFGIYDFPAHLYDYLHDWLQAGFSTVYAHYSSLEIKKPKLPEQLWMGAANQLFPRLLRHYAMRHNIHVTGHDHGHGDGFHLTPSKYMGNYNACHEFISYNSLHENAIKKHYKHEWHLTPLKPEIRSLPNLEKPNHFHYIATHTEKVKTVLYPSTLYSSEQITRLSYFQNIVALDWQARLFHQLNALEYTVLLKLHPEELGYKNPSRSTFESPFDLRIADGNFQYALSQSDAVIFDFAQTSILPNILNSQQPVIYVDFQFIDWNPDFWEWMQRRCAIIQGWNDEANRAQVDWSALSDAIELAVEKANHFYSTSNHIEF